MKKSSVLSMLFAVCINVAAADVLVLQTHQDKTYFYQNMGDPKARGFLLAETEIRVLSRSSDGVWAQVELEKGPNTKVKGYVKVSDLEFGNEEAPKKLSSVKHKSKGDSEDFNRWSFGAGFSGSSSNSGTSLVVGAELRYLITLDFESIFGIDVRFGRNPALGARVAQRYYAPISKKFRPYIHLGLRMADVRAWESAAFDPGVGVQVNYRGGAFFELGINYLLVKPFNPQGENFFVFGGSSGVRF